MFTKQCDQGTVLRSHNPNFKGVDFNPLLAEAGSNAFTMSPTK